MRNSTGHKTLYSIPTRNLVCNIRSQRSRTESSYSPNRTSSPSISTNQTRRYLLTSPCSPNRVSTKAILKNPGQSTQNQTPSRSKTAIMPHRFRTTTSHTAQQTYANIIIRKSSQAHNRFSPLRINWKGSIS